MSPCKAPVGASAPSAVLAIETTENSKIGATSATYVSQQSCPASCPLRDSGCYAEHGPLGFITRRLNRSRGGTPAQLARLEAQAIDGLTGDRPLRLHVVGDCRTPAAARIVAEAAGRYRARRGSLVWSYTHAWRTVPRAAWGEVSVLASCESTAQVRQAQRKGYATALVVDRFRRDGVYDLPVTGSKLPCAGVRVLPCPWQTRRVSCRDCRLCWDDGRLLACGLTIGFEAHGAGAARARLALPVLE
jgi:hypothetical protein